MRKILFFILLILCLLPVNLYGLTADGFEGKDYYTYYGTTADLITVSWTPGVNYNSATDDFELQLHNPERDMTVSLVFTALQQHVFKCPKTGHWIVRVQARRNTNGVYSYSPWSESTDSTVATVDGQPRAWWIFAWIASTGPIEGLSSSNQKSLGLDSTKTKSFVLLAMNDMI